MAWWGEDTLEDKSQFSTSTQTLLFSNCLTSTSHLFKLWPLLMPGVPFLYSSYTRTLL